MNAALEKRLKDIARRAGLSGIAPNVIAVGCAALAVAVLFAAWRFWPHESSGAETFETAAAAPVHKPATNAASAEATEPARVYVHVIGAVARPGVYDVASESRVIDVITAAGGLLADAAPSGVNLARIVVDGEQIAVPTTAQLAAGQAVPGASAPAPGTSGGGASSGGGPININTADASQLDTLPGVGPSTAQKIVADREANGPFASPEDLGRVTGIGPKKLEELKGLICAK